MGMGTLLPECQKRSLGRNHTCFNGAQLLGGVNPARKWHLGILCQSREPVAIPDLFLPQALHPLTSGKQTECSPMRRIPGVYRDVNGSAPFILKRRERVKQENSVFSEMNESENVSCSVVSDSL